MPALVALTPPTSSNPISQLFKSEHTLPASSISLMLTPAPQLSCEPLTLPISEPLPALHLLSAAPPTSPTHQDSQPILTRGRRDLKHFNLSHRVIAPVQPPAWLACFSGFRSLGAASALSPGLQACPQPQSLQRGPGLSLFTGGWAFFLLRNPFSTNCLPGLCVQ